MFKNSRLISDSRRRRGHIKWSSGTQAIHRAHQNIIWRLMCWASESNLDALVSVLGSSVCGHDPTLTSPTSTLRIMGRPRSLALVGEWLRRRLLRSNTVVTGVASTLARTKEKHHKRSFLTSRRECYRVTRPAL